MQNSGLSFRPVDQESLRTIFSLCFFFGFLSFFFMELLINLPYVLSLSCDTKGVLAWLHFFFSSHFFFFFCYHCFSHLVFSPF